MYGHRRAWLRVGNRQHGEADIRLQPRGPEGRADVAEVLDPIRGRYGPDVRVIPSHGGAGESFGFYHRRPMHVFTCSSMTRDLTNDEVRRVGGVPEWHFTAADPMGTSVRRIRENHIVVRSRFTYAPSMKVSDRRVDYEQAAERYVKNN